MIQSQPSTRSRGPGIAQPAIWLGWDDYLAWLSGRLTTMEAAWGETVKLGPPWQPGEHDAMIGPTGEGKSTYAVGRLALRKYVLALDPKGEDETLSQSGYDRVGSVWQPGLKWQATHRADSKTWNKIWKSIEDGGDGRVIVGGPARNDAEFLRLRELMGEAIGFCRYTRGWTLYVDEFEVVSSRDIYNLARLVNLMLITARRAGISVMTSYQAQAWVSKHAIRQARRAVIWPTGDRDMIRNVADGMGRDWRDVADAVDMLPPYHTLTIPRGKHHPMVITLAPELGKSKAKVKA